jgi:hypothetical protein
MRTGPWGCESFLVSTPERFMAPTIAPPPRLTGEFYLAMSALERLVSDLLSEIDSIVDKKVEEKLPEIIRALGIREAEPESEGYVDALEIAKLLGRDLSSPENILKAKKHVYNLARKRLIPSVRISERSVKFDLAKVRETLEAKQTQAA